MTNQTVVITGSAGGIGGGLAQAFFRRGFNVVISDVNQQALNERINFIAGNNSDGRMHSVLCDVTDKQQVELLWQQSAQKYGRIDYWINNAGLGGTGEMVADMDTEWMMAMVDVNIKGVIIGTQRAVIEMAKQGGGRIYNTAGLGVDGFTRPTQIIYGTTKRAVGYFSNGVAKEINGSGTTIGWLNPGMVITPMVIQGARAMGKESWDKGGRKIFNLFGETAETTGEELVVRILKDHRNATFIKLLTLPRMIGRLLTSVFNKRDMFAQYDI